MTLEEIQGHLRLRVPLGPKEALLTQGVTGDSTDA